MIIAVHDIAGSFMTHRIYVTEEVIRQYTLDYAIKKRHLDQGVIYKQLPKSLGGYEWCLKNLYFFLFD